MQHHSVKVSVLLLITNSLVTLGPSVALPHISSPEDYCNEKYMYCVAVPSSGKPEPHEGDSPNHGVTIKLPDLQSDAWTYAHWDAALLESSQKAALNRLGILLDEHPHAEVSMKQTMLSGLVAYRIRLNYIDARPMTEEIVTAYRKPKDKSQGPGVIYEIGLECSQANYSTSISVLESLISTFRRTGD